MARLAAAYGVAARKLGQIVQRQERENARASFAADVLRGRTPDGDGDQSHLWPDNGQGRVAAWQRPAEGTRKRTREEILADVAELRVGFEWAEAVRLFDLEICHGSCGQWRYPSVCEACPGLAFIGSVAVSPPAVALT